MIFLYKILLFWSILHLGYTDEYYNACGNRYFFGTNSITQEEYTNFCQRKNMDKLSFKTENDLRCLSDIISNKSLATLSGSYWTSAKSNDGKTDFKWHTQELVLTKYWGDGFPKTRSGQFKCTILALKSKYSSMENVLCEKSFKPICQENSVVVAQQAPQNTQTCSATCPSSSSTKEIAIFLKDERLFTAKETCGGLFVFSNEEMSFQNADDFCKTLEKTIRKCGNFYVKILSLESIDKYSCLKNDIQRGTFWTSARDDGCPKMFNWCTDSNISGKSVIESLWQSGAPDNFKGRERCAVVNFKTGLNDRNCDLSYSAACEVFHRTIKMFEITTPRPEICRPFETSKKGSKKNTTIAQISPDKYHSIGAWTNKCGNLYHFSYAELSRKKAFEYCISLGMELLYIDSEEEIPCLYAYVNSTDVLQTSWYWSSAACTDCPNRYFWCTGPGEEVSDAFWIEKKPTEVTEIHVGLNMPSYDSEEDEDYDEENNEEDSESAEEEEEEVEDEEDSSNENTINDKSTETTPMPSGLNAMDNTSYELNVICKLPGGTTPTPCNVDCRNVTNSSQLKNNLDARNDGKKLEKLGTLMQTCGNEYLLSKKAMNKTDGDKFCSSIGFELFWSSTASELECLTKEFEDQNFEAWTSGISSEQCPRGFRWCSGPSKLPLSQSVESDAESPTLKILELCIILESSETDNDAIEITFKSRMCSDKKVKSLCKKTPGNTPTTVAPNVNVRNKFQTTIRPGAPTFQIKISGPINMIPNIKMCVPICAPLKPKDFSLFKINGALKTPLNYGTLSTACNKDYMLGKNSMAQSAASQFCGSLGMTLLVVDSVRDLDCLKNALPILRSTDVWTAAADISCTRRFQWCGSYMTVVDALWASDQPPYMDQHRCARLSKSQLRRENCNVLLKALCQSAARTINKL